MQAEHNINTYLLRLKRDNLDTHKINWIQFSKKTFGAVRDYYINNIKYYMEFPVVVLFFYKQIDIIFVHRDKRFPQI